MRKPDWKVAVVGGSIAALGLGGFAAAQSGSSNTDTTVPEGIRLQRDASISIHSLSSVVEVRPSTTLASLASVNDSVPQVTPAPASVDSWDSPASIQSVDSPASVQSLQSPVSVQSVDSPASVQSLDSPASIQSVDSPDSVD